MGCKLCKGEKLCPNKDSDVEFYEGFLIERTGLEGYGGLNGFDLEINFCPK